MREGDCAIIARLTIRKELSQYLHFIRDNLNKCVIFGLLLKINFKEFCIMRRLTAFSVWFLISILCAGNSAAQIPISGPLSGVLEQDVYLVTGDIFVEENDSLTILPGTEFMLNPGSNFLISGLLNATGTFLNKIRFKRAEENTPWGHIVFEMSASDGGILEYCHIEGGHSEQTTTNWPDNCGGGLLIKCDDVIISNCTITGNLAHYCGGGLAVYFSSNALIIDCEINNNTTQGDGGGIEVYGSMAHFENCMIRENDAESSMGMGGGVASGSGDPTFSGCSFIDNQAYIGGGFYCDRNYELTFDDCIFEGNTADYGAGLYFYEEGSGADIRNCLIIDNAAEEEGGGLFSSVSSQNILNCTFSGNSAPLGSGISLNSIYCTIRNNIFEGNSGGACIDFNGAFRSDADYNDFYNNPAGNFAGNYPAEFGIISGVNANGTACDDYANIFENPLFVDQANGDYHLLEGSPCIDAGDPASPPDPDWTVADLGAYYFEQETSIEDFSVSTELRDFGLAMPYPNPFNNRTTISFKLQAASEVELKVFDVTGREVESLVTGHWSPGEHSVVWDASKQTSGVYFVRLAFDGGQLTEVRKVMLVK